MDPVDPSGLVWDTCFTAGGAVGGPNSWALLRPCSMSLTDEARIDRARRELSAPTPAAAAAALASSGRDPLAGLRTFEDLAMMPQLRPFASSLVRPRPPSPSFQADADRGDGTNEFAHKAQRMDGPENQPMQQPPSAPTMPGQPFRAPPTGRADPNAGSFSGHSVAAPSWQHGGGEDGANARHAGGGINRLARDHEGADASDDQGAYDRGGGGGGGRGFTTAMAKFQADQRLKNGHGAWGGGGGSGYGGRGGGGGGGMSGGAGMGGAGMGGGGYRPGAPPGLSAALGGARAPGLRGGGRGRGVGRGNGFVPPGSVDQSNRDRSRACGGGRGVSCGGGGGGYGGGGYSGGGYGGGGGYDGGGGGGRAPAGGGSHAGGASHGGAGSEALGTGLEGEEGLLEHPALRGVDASLVEQILTEVVDKSPGVGWDAIAGLAFAKQSVTEITVLPLVRPELFTGARRPPKGLLLFGPPGTGKTLIAKAIATDSSSTFFSISASSLMSKWMGEGEKMVKALFAVARAKQPSVIFIDEVDSILSQRREGEQEGTIRVKNEVLVQMDGAASADASERLLVVGATNRPQELDDAARRRLQKRLMIPLPDRAARLQMLHAGLKELLFSLSDDDFDRVVADTDGYSGSDMVGLCREAAMEPLRENLPALLSAGAAEVDVRAVTRADFETALCQMRPSVSADELKGYEEWNRLYGSFQNVQSKRQALGADERGK